MSRADFIDLGASNGGSLQFAQSVFGGNGVGVDIDPAKVARAQERGFNCVVADAAALPLPDNSTRFVQMHHFLEHLPNREVGTAVIASAIRAARDFVFMVGPDFGHRRFLARHGLKKCFDTWSGHTWRHTEDDLKEILSGCGYQWALVTLDRITHSYDPILVPLECDANHQEFDSATDPPKPDLQFSRRVYQALGFVVVKSYRFSIGEVLLRAYKPRVVGGRLPPLYGPLP